jgi:hypothetical protein
LQDTLPPKTNMIAISSLLSTMLVLSSPSWHSSQAQARAWLKGTCLMALQGCIYIMIVNADAYKKHSVPARCTGMFSACTNQGTGTFSAAFSTTSIIFYAGMPPVQALTSKACVWLQGNHRCYLLFVNSATAFGLYNIVINVLVLVKVSTASDAEMSSTSCCRMEQHQKEVLVMWI